MLIKPKYYTYLQRIWLQIYINVLTSLIIIIPGIFFFGSKNIYLHLMITIVPIIIIYIVSSMIVNKYYLKSIEINENKRFIELKIAKYDIPPYEIIIDLVDIEVRVSQIQYSYVKWYKIQFYKNRKLVFQQREFKEWDKDTFDKIAAKVKELKSKKI